MNKIVKFNERPKSKRSGDRPTQSDAEDAVRTLIRWAGDDPNREGLRGTPGRVVRAYEEWFACYFEDPRELLKRTFEEVAGYAGTVLSRIASITSRRSSAACISATCHATAWLASPN